MTRTLHLGTRDDGREARVDVDRLIESRLLLQANSGGGKSWALRRILEQSHGLVQHLVLDIEGEFHTMRERFDYVLAARSGGDTLADPRTAALLARRLLELGVSAILDLYELPHAARVRFVRLFLEALIDCPRSLWHPVLVVVDEAHQFCPEKGQAESASAVIDLMTRGRKRGFCGVLATQRLSKLHKDAAAEANVKLIGRAALDVDMKRAAEELGLSSREDQLRLRTLKAGHFFAFGPGLSDAVVEIQVGPVQTTHPRPGARSAPVPPPRERVRKVLAQLADLPKEAEEEARSLAELHATVARLKRELSAKPAPPEPNVERVEVPVVGEALAKRLEKAAASLVEVGSSLQSALARVQAHPGRPYQHAYRGPDLKSPHDAELLRRSARQVHKDLARAVAQPGAADAAPSRLGSAQRAILTVLANRPHKPTTRNQVGIMSGYSTKSSHLDNTISSLRTAGFVEGGSDALRITGSGLEALGPVEPLPTGRALIEYWIREVGKAPGAMLRVIVDAHPGTVTREEVAQATGYSPDSSHLDNSLSRLRTLDLITGGRNELRASEELVA